MWTDVIAVVVGYLLGSIPSAYIAGRLVKGVDIRQVGGRNMGTLNVLREIGTGPGVAVLAADIGKGALAVLAARWLAASEIALLAAGFAAVIGHNIPVYLKFHGGKGAATALGVLLALVPAATGIGAVVLIIIILATSNISLGLTVSFILIPITLWLTGKGITLTAFSLIIAVFLALRYIATLKRALTDPESRKNAFIERRYKPWQARKSQLPAKKE